LEKLEGKRPLGRTRFRLKGSIKLDLIKIWCEGIDLVSSGMGKGQVACSCEHENEPFGSIKGS
jgi:hypothetical protein